MEGKLTALLLISKPVQPCLLVPPHLRPQGHYTQTAHTTRHHRHSPALAVALLLLHP